MGSYNEEKAPWDVSRPAFMREIEPRGDDLQPSAWHSPAAGPQVDPAEQALNRQLFQEKRNRKGPAPSPPAESEQKKAG
jgi:hypothetical protein